MEAQFYLIWPALLFIVLVGLGKRRRLIKWLPLTLAVLSAVLMAVLYNPANLNRVYYGTDTRAFSLLLGACLLYTSTFIKRRAPIRISFWTGW